MECGGVRLARENLSQSKITHAPDGRPAQKKAILKTQILQVYPLARADCPLQKRASRARWPIGPLLRRAPLANVFRQALPSAPRMEIGDLAY